MTESTGSDSSVRGDKKWMVLRVLLNRYHPGSVDEVLKALDEQSVQELMSVEVVGDDLADMIHLPEVLLDRVHYSWFLKPLSQLSKGLLPYFIRVFPKEKQASLQKHLEISDEVGTLSEPMENFLRSYFFQQWRCDTVLPLTFLPEMSMTPLVQLDSQQLLEVIDLVGVHDLAHEVQQVIDRDQLEKLYSCLTGRQQGYLRSILHRPDKVRVSKMGVELWGGDCAKLQKEIHKRGLQRLGKALSGQHPQLLWYVHHVLDTGRSSYLSRFEGEEQPGISHAVMMQVLCAINFFREDLDAKMEVGVS